MYQIGVVVGRQFETPGLVVLLCVLQPKWDKINRMLFYGHSCNM